jgi:DNA-binding MarR family transcriptional regulator
MGKHMGTPPMDKSETTRALDGLTKALTSVQEATVNKDGRSTITVEQLKTFLVLARLEIETGDRQGVTGVHLRSETGLSQSTLSRYMLDLAVQTRTREPGYGLVEQRPDVMDLRMNRYKMTTKGRILLASLFK